MRISDWSSDVCSSDLCPLSELSSRFSTKGVSASGRSSMPSKTYCRVLLAITCPSHFHSHLAIAPHVGNGGGLARQLGPVGDQRVVGGGLLGVLTLVRADVIEAVGEVLHRLSLLRSEEHTSELQSLMRTSSAGFT